MNIQAKVTVCLLFLISCVFLSCGDLSENPMSSECPDSVTKIVQVPIVLEAPDPDGFRPDFSIVTGIHRTGEEVYRSLTANKFRVSVWSSQALLSPDFLMSGERAVYYAVVLSLLEMGFSENELVSLRDVLEKIREIGLLPLTPEQAVSLREQFVAQPDYTTGDRLGEFFVAMEPMDLFADGNLKIFSIHRDDEFPHPGTDVGLWLISNDIEDGGVPRLFNPLDLEDDDLGGRFVCIVPPELNLDILELGERNQE